MENWYDKYLRRHLGNFAIAIGTVIAAIIAVIFGVGVHVIGNIAHETIGKVDHLIQQTNQQIVESRFPPELTKFVVSEKSSMEKQKGDLRKENATLKDE